MYYIGVGVCKEIHNHNSFFSWLVKISDESSPPPPHHSRRHNRNIARPFPSIEKKKRPCDVPIVGATARYQIQESSNMYSTFILNYVIQGNLIRILPIPDMPGLLMERKRKTKNLTPRNLKR